MRLDISGRAAGLAVWGWGIMPRGTPNHLFSGGVCGIKDYLELCRFFVYDWCPKNTASKFLAVTHRLIKKHAPWVKWLYTYAAGFQGMIGHIYKAAGYDYIGQKLCKSFLYIPGIGLVHEISLWHRYGFGVELALRRIDSLVAHGCQLWCGYNFCYIYWLCNKEEKSRLMESAKFTLQPYPTEQDLKIWTQNEKGVKTEITPEFAKTIPIVKLKSKRATSKDSVVPGVQPGEGGASPTVALLTNEEK